MSDCCNQGPRHLVIVGGGSAASAAAIEATSLGARVTMVNAGLPLGGTCVNIGCVPSKALLRAAESHHRARERRFDGIESSSQVTDFAALIAQKRALVTELQQAKYKDVLLGLDGYALIRGIGKLLGEGRVQVGDEVLQADRILIATGSSPSVPPIRGLRDVGYLTSESLFELDALPPRLLVIGAGYIGLECAQLASRLGSGVTLLQRGPRILSDQPVAVTDGLLGYLREEGIDVRTGTTLRSIARDADGITAQTSAGEFLYADAVLLAAGIRGNSAGLGLAELGIEVDERGFVKVDDTLATSSPGVFAAGDIIGAPLYVYTAAYEGKIATQNALLTTATPRDYGALPWVVFTDPQLAGVGMDLTQATAAGVDAEVATVSLRSVPRAIAARDTRGMVTLTRERTTGKLLGARVLAPEGGELVTAVGIAIAAGMTSDDLSRMLFPYLTLSESLKLAALAFDKDLASLSCCAA